MLKLILITVLLITAILSYAMARISGKGSDEERRLDDAEHIDDIY